jgi:hypothetical protein
LWLHARVSRIPGRHILDMEVVSVTSSSLSSSPQCIPTPLSSCDVDAQSLRYSG